MLNTALMPLPSLFYFPCRQNHKRRDRRPMTTSEFPNECRTDAGSENSIFDISMTLKMAEFAPIPSAKGQDGYCGKHRAAP
jgi:hypothetical protein